MPGIQLIAEPWTDEQEARFVDLQRRFRDHNEQRLCTLLDRLEQWMSMQSQLNLAQWSRGDIYVRFLLSTYPEGGTTVINCYGTLTKYAVDPHNVRESKERLRIHYLGVTLRKWCSTRRLTKVGTFTMEELARYLEPLVNHRLDLWYRTLWFGLLATGSRVPHATIAKEVVFGGQGRKLIVVWSHRKCDSTESTVSYDLSWSVEPPEDIKRNILKHKRFWPEAYKLATTSLNSWLRNRTLPSERRPTGRAPRVRMSHHMVRAVEEGLISREQYRLAMDHSYDTALKSYARPLDDADSSESESE